MSLAALTLVLCPVYAAFLLIVFRFARVPVQFEAILHAFVLPLVFIAVMAFVGVVSVLLFSRNASDVVLFAIGLFITGAYSAVLTERFIKDWRQSWLPLALSSLMIFLGFLIPSEGASVGFVIGIAPVVWHSVTAGVLTAWAQRERESRRDKTKCRQCDYDLSCLPGPRCPECGTEIPQPTQPRD